jgi:phosphoribosylamine--glycine ligase
VFHSGTGLDDAGTFRTNGGRVLTVVGRGADLAAARDVAERAADAISWPGMQRRHDIALHAPVAEGVA